MEKDKGLKKKKTVSWGRLLVQMSLSLGAAALASTMLTYLEMKRDQKSQAGMPENGSQEAASSPDTTN